MKGEEPIKGGVKTEPSPSKPRNQPNGDSFQNYSPSKFPHNKTSLADSSCKLSYTIILKDGRSLILTNQTRISIVANHIYVQRARVCMIFPVFAFTLGVVIWFRVIFATQPKTQLQNYCKIICLQHHSIKRYDRQLIAFVV